MPIHTCVFQGITTCLDPEPGEYRFVYWGIMVDEDSQDWSDAAIVAPFSIVEGLG
jgi:hypothetical protein